MIRYELIIRYEYCMYVNLYIFENDNSNSRMSCSSIGISNDNIIMFGLDNGSIYYRYLHTFENDILIIVCIVIVNGNIIWSWLGY